MKQRNWDTYHKNPRALFLALLVFLVSPLLEAATVPNTEISNTVFVSYDNQPGPDLSASVSFVTSTDSPSSIEFLQIAAFDSLPTDRISLSYQGSACSPNASLDGPFIDSNLSDLGGNAINPGTNLDLIEQPSAFYSGDVVFVKVTDYDQNLDASLVEIIPVTVTNDNGDREVIEATETAADSGEFLGAIQTRDGAPFIGNCFLDVGTGNQLSASYVDGENSTDTVSSFTLIDPFGVIFDSLTGEPINGVVISLFAQATGELAEVYSFNGIDRWPSTVISSEPVTDASGTVFPMTDGEYRFPRVVAGFYYFEISVPSGYIYPSTREFDDLQTLPGAPYVLFEASRGAVFEVPPGPDVQVDIPFDPVQGELVLEKTVSNSTASVGDFLFYNIAIQNPETDRLADLVIEDIMPTGFRLQEASLRINDNEANPGSFTFDEGGFEVNIGDLESGQSADISYIVEVTAGAENGEAINKAQSISRLATSNLAEAPVLVSNDLFQQKSYLIGRVYEGSCDAEDSDELHGIAGAKIYFEDGMSVTTDSNGRWHLDDIEPGTHVIRLDESSLGEDYELVPCNVNSRNFQTPHSAFVDLEPNSLWTHNFVVRKTASTNTVSSLLENLILDRDFADIDQMPTYDTSWLGTDEFEVLWPENGYTPRYRSTKIAVRHMPNESVNLFINDSPVSPLNRREGVTSPIFPQRISTWGGIDLEVGYNQLEVRRMDSAGNQISSETRTIYYAGSPYSAEFVPELSHLAADGVNPAIVAVRLTDAEGYPVRPSTSGSFEVSAPFVGWLPEHLRFESQVLSESDNTARYVVREDGIAYFPIEATTQTGRIAIEVPLTDSRSETIEAWISADARDWIMVGLAEGTYGRAEIEGSLEPLTAEDDDYYQEGRVAFFGKGRIPGDFLMTIAYDSAKESSDNPDELFDAVDPDAYYTVYGDESQQHNEAQSSKKLFLKIERSQFYALFGDFQTGMTITELSSYNRSLTGVKSEFKTEHFEANLFASETSLANIREEIPGNGTAGRYFLSRRNIVDFTENVVIEVRDRFQTGQILSETPLTRNTDYDIDYDLGTILFKNPILTRDRLQNPIYIVVNYETQDDREAALVAGGRIEVSTADDRIELGLSHITEENRGAEAELTGIDLTYEATDSIEVRGEFAVSDTVAIGNAEAWSVAGEFEDGRVTSRVYAQQQDGGFGMGQQNASESGTRKYGVSSDIEFGENYSFRATADNQILLDTDSENTQALLEARRVGERTAIELGYRWASESNPLTDTTSSELVNLGASYQLADNLRLDASREFSINDTDQSSIFPTRDRLGAEWQINGSSALYIANERTSGGSETENTQIGLRTSMWTGSEINIGVDQSDAAGNEQISAVAGLTQRAQITDNLSLDFSFDSGRDLSTNTPASGINAETPSTAGSGGNDYQTGSLGWDWRNDNWSWNNQLEHRTSDSNDSSSVRTGILRRLESGKSLLSSVEWFETESIDRSSEDITFSLGYADRSSQNFALLNRIDLATAETTVDGQSIREEKLISNNHLNLTRWEDSQLSLIYSAKYVLTTINDSEYKGYTDLLGAQYRHDLGQRWDIGLQASTLRSQNSNTNKYSYGASIGFSPMRDTWLELGYNLSGFADDDFDASDWTEEGVYFSIRYKFDESAISRISQAANAFRPASLASPEPRASLTPVAAPVQQVEANAETAATQLVATETPTPTSLPETTDIEPSESIFQDTGDFTCTTGSLVRVIQLATFSNLETARSFIQAADLGSAFVEEYQPTNSEALYRVVVGPYTQTKAELADSAAVFQQATGFEPWVKEKDCADLRRLD